MLDKNIIGDNLLNFAITRHIPFYERILFFNNIDFKLKNISIRSQNSKDMFHNFHLIYILPEFIIQYFDSKFIFSLSFLWYYFVLRIDCKNEWVNKYFDSVKIGYSYKVCSKNNCDYSYDILFTIYLYKKKYTFTLISYQSDSFKKMNRVFSIKCIVDGYKIDKLKNLYEPFTYDDVNVNIDKLTYKYKLFNKICIFKTYKYFTCISINEDRETLYAPYDHQRLLSQHIIKCFDDNSNKNFIVSRIRENTQVVAKD